MSGVATATADLVSIANRESRGRSGLRVLEDASRSEILEKKAVELGGAILIV